MSIESGHFRLTPEQRRFKDWLPDYLQPFWNFDSRDCDLDGLRDALNGMSHGEAINARFYAGIWCGENVLSFDLIDATKTLDTESLQVISDWLADPWWP